MGENKAPTGRYIDELIERVSVILSTYVTPAKDPEFYDAKSRVREFLGDQTGIPVFFAVEPGRVGAKKPSFVLGVGNDVERVHV